MSTYDLDEWIDGSSDYNQPTSVNMQRETVAPKDEDVKAMRAIVSEAIMLFARKRDSIQAECFHDKDTDWQLALSEAVVMRDHPDLQNCTIHDAIFFIRMHEVFKIDDENRDDPRVFVAGVIGSPQPHAFFPYSCRFWSSVPPGWRGSEKANARCNPNDVAPIAQCIIDCIEECSVNQMPNIVEDVP